MCCVRFQLNERFKRFADLLIDTLGLKLAQSVIPNFK